MSETAKITRIEGTGIPLEGNDIDTDRIIPARFLMCVTFDGLGEHAFSDERQKTGTHPFDDERFRGGSILIVNKNFGCGSSREHAPQALMRYGIRAIIGESFAEIFYGNCVSLGIPAVTAPEKTIGELMGAVRGNPSAVIALDLERKRVDIAEQSFAFDIREPVRSAFANGSWSPLDNLLKNEEKTAAVAARLPYMKWNM